jgi:hypothetical protein
MGFIMAMDVASDLWLMLGDWAIVRRIDRMNSGRA